MYRLFYNYKLIGDILIIVMKNKDVNKKVIKDNLVLLYNDNELIGINILNFSNIVKTRASGMIINPPKELINIINHMLVNANEAKLPFQKESGFIVGKVIENNNIDIGESNLIKIINQNKINDYVVIAKPDTILATGEITTDYKIANPIELGYEINEQIEFSSSMKPGNDYFKEI